MKEKPGAPMPRRVTQLEPLVDRLEWNEEFSDWIANNFNVNKLDAWSIGAEALHRLEETK